jgi:hypothetical protein
MKQTSAYWITFYQRGKGKKFTKFTTLLRKKKKKKPW